MELTVQIVNFRSRHYLKKCLFSIAENLAKEIERRHGCRVLKEAAAFAWYDEEILAVSRPGEFWELKQWVVLVQKSE